jgi:hypothetical protein
MKKDGDRVRLTAQTLDPGRSDELEPPAHGLKHAWKGSGLARRRARCGLAPKVLFINDQFSRQTDSEEAEHGEFTRVQ